MLLRVGYLANELCTLRIVSELLRASPFMLASKAWVNSLNSPSVGPRWRSGCLQLSRILMMAWVAQALLMTCLAKKILSNRLSWTTVPTTSSFGTHLKRKMSPWIGLQWFQCWIEFPWSIYYHYSCIKNYFKLSNCSGSKLHSSSTWTPWTSTKKNRDKTLRRGNLCDYFLISHVTFAWHTEISDQFRKYAWITFDQTPVTSVSHILDKYKWCRVVQLRL